MTTFSKWWGAAIAVLSVVAPGPQPASAQNTLAAPAPASAAPAASGATESGNRMTVERVLVRVNGEVFSQGQLTTRQIETLQEMNRGGNKLEASIAEITPALLVSAVDELLLVQRGRELGYKFGDDQFKQALDNIKKDNNNLTDDQLKAALAQSGLTLELLRQRLERSYLVNTVQQREVGRTLSITTEEMRQFYEKNKAEFMTPLTVTLRELMVAVPTRTENGKEVFSAADDAAAKTKIEGIRARVLAGENFTTLVSQLSDSPTKSNGGLIGPLNFDDINPTLKDAVSPLQVGGVTNVMRGPRGYQIFQLDNRSIPSQRPFDSVKNEIEMGLREERIQPETEKLLARLRSQAVIEWKDDTYRKLYEQELAKLAAQ
jgi:parvulin-like peptidyl-prolyl isomerase